MTMIKMDCIVKKSEDNIVQLSQSYIPNVLEIGDNLFATHFLHIIEIAVLLKLLP